MIVPRSKGKPLPESLSEILLAYDYALVKFRDKDEAYRAEGQLVEFKVVQVGTLHAQVRIHVFVRGLDKKSGKNETVDVDAYLPISEFREASRLLRGLKFAKDKHGVLRVSRGRAKKRKRR